MWNLSRARKKKQGTKKYLVRKFKSTVYKNSPQYRSIKDGQRFHRGFACAPRDQQGNPICNPNHHPRVSDSDMAWCKTGGQVFYRLLQDANRHSCLMNAGHTTGNEDTEAHELNDKFTLDVYGSDYDRDDTSDLKDGEKGSIASFSKTFQHAKNQYCSKHTEKAVVYNGGHKGDKAAYQHAMASSTMEQLAERTAAIPSLKARGWLTAAGASSLYPIAAAQEGRRMFGRTASQGVEGINRSTKQKVTDTLSGFCVGQRRCQCAEPA